jgi:flagellar assembly protein FliH
LQQAKATKGNGASRRIEAFDYPAGPDVPSMPEWNGWENVEDAAPQARATTARDEAAESHLNAGFEARLTEEKRRAFEAGREQGRQEGRKAEHEAQSGSQAAAQRQRAQQATALIESFTQEKDRYLGAVEQEVVQLALAIAARILRREAQMDPLLLTGAVRVALGQLSGSTKARLLVPEAELDLWTEAIALLPNLAVKPTVTAGEGMRLGECMIETDLGSVDLGIRAQLGEIERGFFDRAGNAKSGSFIPGSSKANAAELAGAADTSLEKST